MTAAFMGDFFTGSGRGSVPRQLLEALKQVRGEKLRDCSQLDGIALYRAQGAFGMVDELLEAMERGTPAPAPDAGISGA